MLFFSICLRSILAYRSSSTHDHDLVCNLQTRWLHYPNIQPKPSRSPPQLENLFQSIDRLGEYDMTEIDRHFCHREEAII
jgi:hypothetical protein